MTQYETEDDSSDGDEHENPQHECARRECGGLTPFDMAAIAINGNTYCTPKCARAALEEVRGHPDETPSEITLLDPQNHVDKSVFYGVDEDEMTLTRRVMGLPDAMDAVDEIEEMYPGPFRAGEEFVDE